MYHVTLKKAMQPSEAALQPRFTAISIFFPNFAKTKQLKISIYV